MTRMQPTTAEADVSVASRQMQAAPLPLQNYFGAREATRLRQPAFASSYGVSSGYGVVSRGRDYFGASESTIFSKRGSSQRGSQCGSSRISAYSTPPGILAELSSCLIARSRLSARAAFAKATASRGRRVRSPDAISARPAASLLREVFRSADLHEADPRTASVSGCHS